MKSFRFKAMCALCTAVIGLNSVAMSTTVLGATKSYNASTGYVSIHTEQLNKQMQLVQGVVTESRKINGEYLQVVMKSAANKKEYNIMFDADSLDHTEIQDYMYINKGCQLQVRGFVRDDFDGCVFTVKQPQIFKVQVSEKTQKYPKNNDLAQVYDITYASATGWATFLDRTNKIQGVFIVTDIGSIKGGFRRVSVVNGQGLQLEVYVPTEKARILTPGAKVKLRGAVTDVRYKTITAKTFELVY